MTGNEKIETLSKECHRKFPYLYLCVFERIARNQVKKEEDITPISGDRTLASVSDEDFDGDISISIADDKNILELEKEFHDVAGLIVKVCYVDDNEDCHYISNYEAGNHTLSEYNDLCDKWDYLYPDGIDIFNSDHSCS